jgi:uncharacterized protein (DUF885 family)
MRPSLTQDETIGRAMALAHDVWLEGSRTSSTWSASGQPLRTLPRFDFAEAERRAGVGKALLERAAAIDIDALPHELALTVKVAVDRAEAWSRQADWYWLVFDPLGVGFYALFAPTAYGGGFLLSGLVKEFAALPLASRGDRDRYLGLVSDYADMVRQLLARTEGQAERGIYMPKAQLAQACPLLGGLKAQAMAALKPSPERAGDDAETFLAEVGRRLGEQVAPAYDDFIAFLSGDYASHCSDQVGIGQYPGGREVYETLIKLHTTMELTPDQVHARGHERMASIWKEMDELLNDAGFDGDAKSFVRAAGEDPAWRAEGAEAIAAVFQRYIDRLKPRLEEAFHRQSAAPYHAEALPAALEGSMTFGFYDPPSGDQPAGRYVFNAANVSKSDLCGIASLTYHELAPGHHMHLSRQLEAEHLHPLRKAAFCNAYNEGWAEYAATLAGELGAYEAPQEKFGRLMMDAFLTSRLVVDTGMNVMGWSLEQARDYMREKTFMSEAEIGSEPVRYSCDIPGQALAYKLGDTRIMELREEMREALGNRFDIRDFHEAVLAPGALPLPILADHVRRETERIAKADA